MLYPKDTDDQIVVVFVVIIVVAVVVVVVLVLRYGADDGTTNEKAFPTMLVPILPPSHQSIKIRNNPVDTFMDDCILKKDNVSSLSKIEIEESRNGTGKYMYRIDERC